MSITNKIQQAFSRRYVIKTTMNTLNLTKKEARARVDALLESKILEDKRPDDRMMQLIIENYLRFDHKRLEFKEILTETLNFDQLIAEYDKTEGAQLSSALKDARGLGEFTDKLVDEVKKFEKFFCLRFWNYLPGVKKYYLS